MTNNRAKALEWFNAEVMGQEQFIADGGGSKRDDYADILKEIEYIKTIRAALSEPKWKSMDDIRAYDGQEIDILLNGNARIPNVYFDDDLQQFLTAGTDVPVIIDGDPINEITHWMHLPDAPTGGKS